MDKSPIVTLNGLNTVYTDLLKRIEALGNIYHIKGSYKTLEDLIGGVKSEDPNKPAAEPGDAYNVVNDRPYDNPKDYPEGYDPTADNLIEENANYVCIKKYFNGECTMTNWTEYWFRVNSAFEVANDKSLGLIRIFPKTNEDIHFIQHECGYTYDELMEGIIPLAQNDNEKVVSMGTDIPLAVLMEKEFNLYQFFKQRFAQVTNPPIDSIREDIVTSGLVYLGREGNLLNPTEKARWEMEIFSWEVNMY